MLSSFLSPRSSISSNGATVVTDNAVAFAVSRGLARRSQNREPQISSWFVSREFDILFVCGLAPWLIGIACFFTTGAGGVYPPTKFPQQAMTLLFVVCSLVIGESHQFTSIVRYYSSFRQRTNSYKWQRIPFWLVYALIAEFFVVQIVGPQSSLLEWTFPWIGLILQVLVIAFPAVLMQHVCAQAAAIVQQYCRMGNYNIERAERFMLVVSSWLLTATGVVSIAVPFGFTASRGLDMSIQSTVLSSMVLPLTLLSIGAALLTAGYVIFRGVTKKEWPPLAATLLWSNLVALILLTVPLPGMAYVWLFVPLFFHATQHWALAWRTHKRETFSKSLAAWTRKDYCNQICSLVMPVLMLTVFVLFLPMFLKLVPHSSAFDNLFPGETLSVFLSMLVFYLHYFADRVVWRPKS